MLPFVLAHRNTISARQCLCSAFTCVDRACALSSWEAGLGCAKDPSCMHYGHVRQLHSALLQTPCNCLWQPDTVDAARYPGALLLQIAVCTVFDAGGILTIRMHQKYISPSSSVG